MASVNKVILVGHLGANPESRFMPSGEAVCSIRLATTEKWKDKTTGEARESTEWHRVVAFRRLAEIAAEYLKKGSFAYIEGRLRTWKWQDKDGRDCYTTEIEATEIKFLGSRDERSRAEPARQNEEAEPWKTHATNRQAKPPIDLEDDIPF